VNNKTIITILSNHLKCST